MPSYAVYVIDEEMGIKEYVESFSDEKEAHVKRDHLNEELFEEDEEATMRAIVVEEP